MIRRAEQRDIPALMSLLLEVNAVHNEIRPDLFKGNTTKFDQSELSDVLRDNDKPVFVYEADGHILGHAFCQLIEVRGNSLLLDIKTLYIDDICVARQSRGQHVGRALYEYVRNYAKQSGCYNITLNVWQGNDSAYHFYQSMGMSVQKTGMEDIL